MFWGGTPPSTDCLHFAFIFLRMRVTFKNYCIKDVIIMYQWLKNLRIIIKEIINEDKKHTVIFAK